MVLDRRRPAAERRSANRMKSGDDDARPALSPAAAGVRSRRAARREAEARRQRRSKALEIGAIVVAIALIGIAVIAGVQSWRAEPAPVPAGTESFANLSRDHAPTAVAYDRTPPAGGRHSAVWQNCGFYAAPIAAEHAVHSLEHGAVWITYRPGLPSAEIERLKALAAEQSHMLVSPIADQAAPIIATAWGEQIRLDSVDDDRLD